MLLSVYIENIALIKRLNLEPSGGFCAFTGETGAGKSIIIDSLGLLCGARSDKEIIRTGENEALVEGIFTIEDKATADLLQEMEIEPEEDGSITVTRRISRDGRSGAKINGRNVPLSRLKSVMAQLLSIHGQQDTQAFADRERQLYMLDSFADNGNLLQSYRRVYDEYRLTNAKLEDLRNGDKEREFRLDILRFRINELRNADIKAGEKAELESERKRLANAEKIAAKSGHAYDLLYGRDGSVAENLSSACREMEALTDIIPESSELYERLESAKYEIIDIAETVKGFAESDGENTQLLLDQCESRLELIKKLESKFRADSDDFPALLQEWEEELSINENSEEEIKKLEARLEKLKATLASEGKKLSDSRKKAAHLLCTRMTEELCELDMPGVRFEVDFQEKDYSSNGCDDAEFLISANKGELPKPMSKIASGGELSRIMLCLKCVFARSEAIGTLIFDEIDTGVSGSTAEKIGIRLKKASDGGKTQVICVTHSAILAAKADAHYKISKKETEGRTVTNVESLDYEGRRNELARILGGMNITETVLKAADELLSNG